MRAPRFSGLSASAMVALGTSWFAVQSAAADSKSVVFNSALQPCPVACEDRHPSNWTIYNSFSRLEVCNEPLLFDFSLYNPVADTDGHVKFRVCTAGNSDATDNALFASAQADVAKRSDEDTTCKTSKDAKKDSATLQLSHSGAKLDEEERSSVQMVLKKLEGHFDAGNAPCDDAAMFAYHRGVVAGTYAGLSFGKATVSSVSDRLLDWVESDGATTLAAQLCGKKRNANHVFGLAVDATGNLTYVQEMVKGWNEAKCLNDFETKTELKDVNIWEAKAAAPGKIPAGSSGNGTSSVQKASSDVEIKGDCRVESVIDGDSCGALAERCGISPQDFEKYNPDKNLCSSLVPGQRVCCSAGTLPDIRPKPDEDGTCATHLVKSGDDCSKLAASNGLKKEDIEKFNDGTTWGWYGCKKLLTDTYICLSKGKPPLPYAIPNSVCGPTKPGTEKPGKDEELKDLNPCPLNACCNVWGQCGISGEFCTEKKSETGNPGTSGLRNGCVSSCGTEIENKDDAPSSYGRVAYYETWNFDRPCLNQRIANANTDGSYTIIHWAFAGVKTSDWSVSINDSFHQWDSFKKSDAKKVISFGGWGFSTEESTYNILREAMSPDNRDAFATKIADFLKKESLDGVDFDWEYPGAIDIPGTPPGLETDGPHYLEFLKTMKKKLPEGMTMSIAAPASFWYLKAFPIKKMAENLDYIVYMTYDLHGQWDAGNEYAIDGCPAGNCLRSHVNLTETTTALAMITKAGVPTKKIFVGESSYGRSFKMAKEGCTGPMCTFLGDRLNSEAKKGRCTDTAGYISNAEIGEIVSSYDPDPEVGTGEVKSWHDKASNSDMVVYEGTEWVAYMSETTKSTRRDHWKGFNFAGTIDWAVDLQSFTTDDWRDPETGDSWDDDQELPPPLKECKESYNSLQDIVDNDKIPSHCVTIYMLEVVAANLTKSMETYDELMAEGYDKKFNTYAEAVASGGEDAVSDFMWEHADDYFDCDVTFPIHCCKSCYYDYGKDDPRCDYCDNKYCNGWDTICEQPEVNCDGVEYGWRNITGCPPDYSNWPGGEPEDYNRHNSIYWKLRDDDSKKFWADLYSNVGIEEKDVEFKDVEKYHFCTPATPEDCKYYGWDYNFPVPQGYDKDDVINPKDVVENAYNNLTGIVKDLPKAVKQIKDLSYSGDADDLLDAVSLPVFIIDTAVKNIENIADTVDEWEEEKRKGIILAFLTAIFFFVPVVGEVIGSVTALAGVGRIIALLGEAGAIATDIYGIVDSKDNDPLAIFGIVLAPLAIFDAAQIAKAASKFRNMKPDDIAKLGKGVEESMNLISKGRGSCKLSKRNVVPMGALPMSGLNGEAIWSRDFQ